MKRRVVTHSILFPFLWVVSKSTHEWPPVTTGESSPECDVLIAHVRYIKILTRLRGFVVIFVLLVWYSLCSKTLLVTARRVLTNLQLTTPENPITYHNALCLSPQNFAYALFSVSLGAILTPKRNWRQCLCKILGWQTKSIMVYYGIFWIGEFWPLSLGFMLEF